MQGDFNKIALTKEGLSIVFDILVPTTTGRLYCLKFQRYNQEVMHIGVKQPEVTTTINTLHAKLGHMHETATKKVAAALGLEIIPKTMAICEACAKAKAQQKTYSKLEDNVPQQTLELGERRIYLDIAQLKRPTGASSISKSYWRIMVDEATQLKFTAFFNTKDGMINATCV